MAAKILLTKYSWCLNLFVNFLKSNSFPLRSRKTSNFRFWFSIVMACFKMALYFSFPWWIYIREKSRCSLDDR